METMSFKALAMQVLQGNRAGNFLETECFQGGKLEGIKSVPADQIRRPAMGEEGGAYLRAVRGSVTRPGDFNRLAPDYRRTWQATVCWYMVEEGMEREGAEERAWALLLPTWGNSCWLAT